MIMTPLTACNDEGSQDTTSTASSTGTSTSSGGGTGGTISSGGGGMGGSTSSGGGSGGTSSGGGTPPFWDGDFVPDQLPTPATGNHNAGADGDRARKAGSVETPGR